MMPSLISMLFDEEFDCNGFWSLPFIYFKTQAIYQQHSRELAFLSIIWERNTNTKTTLSISQADSQE